MLLPQGLFDAMHYAPSRNGEEIAEEWLVRQLQVLENARQMRLCE